MPYMMPIRREVEARRLAGMLRGHGEWIAEELEPRMRAVLKEGEELPDVAHLLDVLGRMVMAESKGLDEADTKRSFEGGEVHWLRKQLRDEAGPELRRRVRNVRQSMRQAYGAKRAKSLLGFEGRTPRKIDDLEDLAVVMVRRLPALKPVEAPGVKIDPAGWAEHLRPALDTVSDLQDQLHQRGNGAHIAVKVKKEVLAAFDRTYRRVMKIGEMFYLLAGLDHVAKHLRRPMGRPVEKIKSTPRTA